MLLAVRSPHSARVAALATALVLLTTLCFTRAQIADARSPADDLLRITSHVTYVILTKGEPVHVIWRVALENNDPATVRRPSEDSLFYSSVALPVLRGASDIQAAGPAGGALSVQTDSPDEGPVTTAVIAFDRFLFYEQRYEFTLSYDLADTRSDILLVTPAYVHLPAIVAGDTGTVRVVAPTDTTWDVTAEPFDCVESAPLEYLCGSSDHVQVAAWVEVTDPRALRNFDSAVALSSGDIALTVSYFPGEEGWASHIQDLAAAALPALEASFGFPYQGPFDLTVAERGRQDIAGYEGTFGCGARSCTIGISPVADDTVALHEFAHLWTEMFEKRWLAEGLAEFLSRAAAASLAPLVALDDSSPPPSTIDLRLDEWGHTRYIIGADEDVLALEQAGYQQSRRFFETLEETVGLDALRAANAAAAAEHRDIDSERYLDLLEETSGTQLDGLFLEHVFPASFAPTLDQRRRTRERLAALQADVEATDLHLRERTQDLVDDWRFDSAEATMDEIEAALLAYNGARARLERPRTLWEKVGLWGNDPDAELRTAVAEFDVGRFPNAVEHAEAARDLLAGAERAGRARALGAGGVLGGIIIVAGISGIWLVRRRKRAAQ